MPPRTLFVGVLPAASSHWSVLYTLLTRYVHTEGCHFCTFELLLDGASGL